MSLRNQDIIPLLDSEDYRTFARQWLRLKQSKNRFGFADIARYGGFSARSFPRDVMNGSKRLTLTSLSKFVTGMQLRGDLAEYFRTLVEIEHEDCRTKKVDLHKLREFKSRLRSRILTSSGVLEKNDDSGFKVFHLPEVYAALGSSDVGATIADIAKRTQLSAHDIESSLSQLLASGIAARKRARYFAQESHLNIEGLKQSEVFKRHFVWSCERAAKMAKVGLTSDSKLFLSSALSVKSADLPKLKSELRQLLLKFADHAETADGDKVVNLVTSLF